MTSKRSFKGNAMVSGDSIIMKLGNLDEIKVVNEKIEGAGSFMVKNIEFYIPLGDLINVEEELKKLNAELDHAKGFLASIEGKLSNESFVKNAPEKVVAIELKKKADAETKIKALEEQMAGLKKG